MMPSPNIFIGFVLLCFLLNFVNANENCCYHSYLEYGEKDCFKNLQDQEVLESILTGDIKCKKFACTPFIPSINANICVYKETHEIHLWILYENATRKMYRIETFNNGEEYNVLRIAEKSGWITFLIDINAKRLAYRLTVNLNNLSEFKTNVIGLEFLGNKIGLVWQPYMEYEKYAFFNETAVNKQKWCHHGKKCSEEVYFDYHFNLCKDANDPAVKFMPGKMEDDPKTKESNPLVIWAIIAAVVVLCAVIIVFLIFYVKYCRKQSKSQSRRMADNPYDRLRKKEEDDEKAQKQSARNDALPKSDISHVNETPDNPLIRSLKLKKIQKRDKFVTSWEPSSQDVKSEPRTPT